MKTILCDICGGKIVIKSGGIAVCEDCGTEHSAERMKEKIQEIQEYPKFVSTSAEPERSRSIQVDNQKLFDNYLEMAECAYEGGNESAAEAYCNKAIELDAKKYKAWLLKGKAIGWQSTLYEPRLVESGAAFVKAATNASNQEKKAVINDIKDELFNLSISLIEMQAEQFIENPTEAQKNEIISYVEGHYDYIEQISKQVGANFEMSAYLTKAASIISKNVAKAYIITILPRYEPDPEGDFYPNREEFKEYIKRIGFCAELFEMVINMKVEAGTECDKSALITYDNLITCYEGAIDACSYVRKFDEKRGRLICEDLSLSDAAKDIRRKKINEYKEKIKHIELSIEQKQEEEAKARFNEYWSEHADEKRALEQEKESLEIQVKNLLDEIEGLPGNAEKLQLQAHLKCLIIEQKSLGLFEIKKRHSIQEQIDKAYLELNELKAQMAPGKGLIESRIKPLEDRLAEIMHELTQDR